MEQVLDIYSPLSAGWTPWLLLLLLMGWVTVYALNPVAFVDCFVSVVADMERRYTDAAKSWGLIVLSLVLRMCTLALAIFCFIYIYSYRLDLAGVELPFSLSDYLCVLLVISVVYAIKSLLEWLLNIVFCFTPRTMVIYQHYANLFTVVSLLLFPILLFTINFAYPKVIGACLLLVAGVYMLVMMIKMCRIYLHSLRALLYILLYLVTVEILPLLCMVWASARVLCWI